MIIAIKCHRLPRPGKDYHRRNVMMMNKQDTPPKNNLNLNGNDMYFSGVMGKNLACNDEEQAGWPPKKRYPPQPKW